MESEHIDDNKPNEENTIEISRSTKGCLKDSNNFITSVKNEDTRPTIIRYKKRGGTAGAQGQLYESTLLSLVLFRCLTDNDIEEFQIASNLDGVGSLDDICLRLTYKDKPVVAFIQAKHKDDSWKTITDDQLLKGKISLRNCFDSYLKIRNKLIAPNGSKDIFRDKLEDVELNLIVYTSAVNKISKDKIKSVQVSDWLNKIKSIISCKPVAKQTTKKQIKRQTHVCHTQDTEVQDIFQLAYDDTDLKILLNLDDNEEMSTAKEFLKTLYIYTNQGQYIDVANRCVGEMSNYFREIKNKRISPENTFILFHDKVQKWWLKTDRSYYLTNTCDYLEQLLTQTFIDTLSSMFELEKNKYSIKFKPSSVENLQFNRNCKITNVVTRSLLLTSMKLKQFYDHLIIMDCKHLYNCMKGKERNWTILMEEFKSKKGFNLALVCETLYEEQENVCLRLIESVRETLMTNIVIVSNETLDDLTNDCNIEVLLDEINFTDLTTETQNELLEYRINFQGQNILLKQLVQNDFNVIDSDLINMIIDKVPIILGQSLSNSSYENIKELYIPRVLTTRTDRDRKGSFSDSYHPDQKLLKTFKGSDKYMNLIVAEPGMGKSTLLTHLSIETKKQYPEIWIVRINLLDYCDDFKIMQADFNRTSFIRLIFKSQFGHVTEFEYNEVKGNSSNEHNENDKLKQLEREMMMYCFNKGNMIFVFDGFDEICPDYQAQVISFIKHANGDDRSNRFQVWLTSRPYDEIILKLEKEFGKFFILQPLSARERYMFYHKHWNLNLPTEIDNKQYYYNNIIDFMRFMNTLPYHYNHKLSYIHMPLYEMYQSAGLYFINILLSIGSEQYLNKYFESRRYCPDVHRLLSLIRSGYFKFYNTGIKTTNTDIINTDQTFGVPLYMNMAASYFVSEIKNDIGIERLDWNLDSTTLNCYERFIELKLKIHFEEKHNMKISKPGVKTLYDNECKNIIAMHRKLGFYAMNYRSEEYIEQMITQSELEDIKETIEKIKTGNEKTGLIDRIQNGVPKFIHLTFAEYFAVEFVVSKIISKEADVEKIMHYVIYYHFKNCPVGSMSIFNQKLRVDKQLKEVLNDSALREVMSELVVPYLKENILYGVDFKEFTTC